MSTNERGSLKSAFANFSRQEADQEAERKLLGRTVEAEKTTSNDSGAGSYPVATTSHPGNTLIPRPLLHREPVRQLSFRCPVTLAQELRRKAAFNQLEQQQIIVEGIKRVLSELPSPPDDWQE